MQNKNKISHSNKKNWYLYGAIALIAFVLVYAISIGGGKLFMGRTALNTGTSSLCGSVNITAGVSSINVCQADSIVHDRISKFSISSYDQSLNRITLVAPMGSYKIDYRKSIDTKSTDGTWNYNFLFLGKNRDGTFALKINVVKVVPPAQEVSYEDCITYRHYEDAQEMTSRGLAQFMSQCNTLYPQVWNLSPGKCSLYRQYLKNGELTAKLENIPGAMQEAAACSVVYPNIWNLSEEKCSLYKQYLIDGVLTAKLQNVPNGMQEASLCSSLYPAIWNVNENKCTLYKQYLTDGVLTAKLQNVPNGMQEAAQCSAQFPLIWNLTAAKCTLYKQYLTDGVLTAKLQNVPNGMQEARTCSAVFPNIWNQ